MKRVDFENGTVTGNILEAALPMLVAQILNLLYNIVDPICSEMAVRHCLRSREDRRMRGKQ